jgi:hypothetical protein
LSARQKLNALHFGGILFIAMVVGLIAESLLAGVITLVILAILSVEHGQIRFDRPPRGPPVPRSRRRRRRR